jgi:Ca2+:H+ antiporter
MTNLLSQTWFITLLGAALIGAVLAAVHHAEVVAHKTGEPFGTLILALCITIIETTLIVSLMLAGQRRCRSHC